MSIERTAPQTTEPTPVTKGHLAHAAEHLLQQHELLGDDQAYAIALLLKGYIEKHGDTAHAPEEHPAAPQATSLDTPAPAALPELEIIDQDLEHMNTLTIADSEENLYFEQPRDAIGEIEGISRLNQEIQSTFADLVRAFNTKIPQKSKMSIGHGKTEWDFEQIVDKQPWSYAFEAEYKRGRERNELTAVTMRFGHKLPDTPTKHTLKLDISNGFIAGVTLSKDKTDFSTKGMTDAELRKHIAEYSGISGGTRGDEGTYYGSYRDDAFGGNNIYSRHRAYGNAVTHRLTINPLQTNFDSTAVGINGSIYGSVKRRFNGSSNSFDVEYTDQTNTVTIDTDAMPADHAVIFAKAVAGLIPTRKLDV